MLDAPLEPQVATQASHDPAATVGVAGRERQPGSRGLWRTRQRRPTQRGRLPEREPGPDRDAASDGVAHADADAAAPDREP